MDLPMDLAGMFAFGETDLEEILEISAQIRAQNVASLAARDALLDRKKSLKGLRRSAEAQSLWLGPNSLSPSLAFRNIMEDSEAIDELPPKDIMDELIILYFSNTHPFCPIINESLFCEEYFCLSTDEFLGRFPLIVLYAILCAGIAHTDTYQLHRLGHNTVVQAQAAFVNVVKRLYRQARYATSNGSDELVLAKACLLLSYWHPMNDTETNSCWADRALHHVKRSLADQSTAQIDAAFRQKTVYWCCIVRNTLINFVTRRPYRVKTDEEPMFDVANIRPELKSELSSPMFADTATKHFYIETLVATCRLVQVLIATTRSRKQALFESQWNPESHDEVASGTRADSLEYVRGFLEAGAFEGQITAILRAFEGRVANPFGEPGQATTGVGYPVETTNNVPAEYFRVLCHSSIAALYQPYLRRRIKKYAESCQHVALEKVKEASMHVSAIIERLLGESNVEAIPFGIVAWTALPVTTYLIGGKRDFDVRQTTEQTPDSNHLIPENAPNGAQKMLKLAHLMASRSESGQVIWMLLQEVNRLACLRNRVQGMDGGVEVSAGLKKPLTASISAEDLDLLVEATKMIDLNLAYEGPR